MCDSLLAAMVKRGAQSWTSPDPALRCAIATVNVPPIVRMELEKWMWTRHKIRHPRRRAVEAAPLHAVLPAAARRGPVPREVRRLLEREDDMISLLVLAAATFAAAADPAPPNQLTPAEKKAGWRLLFDGKTTAGWRGFKKTDFPPTAGW